MIGHFCTQHHRQAIVVGAFVGSHFIEKVLMGLLASNGADVVSADKRMRLRGSGLALASLSWGRKVKCLLDAAGRLAD